MELGTVISTMDSPTTNRFSFVIANASVVRKARFVQLKTEEGTLLGVVQDIVRANRYFERAESVSEYEKNGKKAGAGINSSFSENFPTEEWEFAVAQCAVLGAYDTNLRRASFPAAPGAKVHDADLKLLKDFFAFEDSGIHIGKLLVHDLDVKLNMNKLFQKHLAILGISGSGKSITSAVMIEELLLRSKEQGRLAAVVFDAHGEYVSFSDKKHNPEFADKVTVINANKVQIAAKNLSPGLISKLLPGISHTQMRDLAPILEMMKKEVREGAEAFGLEQIVQRAQASDMKENVKDALLSWLFELRNLKIVSEHDSPQLKKIIKPGCLVVFDLSSIVNMQKKQIIVSYISEKMFALRRKDELPPYVMIVEEAHNFAPEKAEKKYAISKGVINTVAREGRKFGASLCLISQRPVQLSTTALSQMNTMLIMKITNPYDLKHIAESAEAIDADTQNLISSLRVGEGVIIGEAVNYPVFVRVRNRKTKKLSKGDSLEELAKHFEEKQSLAEAISDADVNDAFLQ
ncbi:MAG TPA: ATP-binding protein [Candidatus Norongarragalinales archaeon]|nr:ATP-binding protein [Candidatus Norongarragalinales archaeon]